MTRKVTNHSATMHLLAKGGIQIDTTGVAFKAYSHDNGDRKLLGTLKVSAGGVRWLPAHHTRPFRVTWGLFSEVLEAFGEKHDRGPVQRSKKVSKKKG